MSKHSERVKREQKEAQAKEPSEVELWVLNHQNWFKAGGIVLLVLLIGTILAVSL